MAKIQAWTDYRVKASGYGRASRFSKIEVIDGSGGYRWTFRRHEALQMAGDLVVAVAETGGHAAAVSLLSDLADRVTEMKSQS